MKENKFSKFLRICEEYELNYAVGEHYVLLRENQFKLFYAIEFLEKFQKGLTYVLENGNLVVMEDVQ